MFRRFTRKRVVVALSAIAVLGLAASAYAYFSSTGTGTGSATVGKSTAFTVGQTATSGGPLYPDTAVGGANIVTDSYTVTNPSAGNQNLNQVAISVANADGSAWTSKADPSKPACTASDFSVGGQTAGSSWTDASLKGDFTAGQAKTGTVKVEMIDNGANQDNCQGVTVPLYLSAS